MEHTLIIRHLGDQNGEPEFTVVRQTDAKTGAAVTLTPPERIMIEGRPDSDLMQDLRWYLEHFLDYPSDPNTQLADRVLAALKGWGEQIFTQLFQGQAYLWYGKARHDGLTTLHLKIASDDPRILAWPWEALRDPQGTTLAQTCRIERQLSELHDPLPLPDTLARNRINILLIIARPYGETDVGYHALSRPMVELVRKEHLPVHIDVVRPPTFAQLRRRLHEKPGFYHIVHFDGHGGYGADGHFGSPHTYKGPQGRLIFETEDGDDDAIEAGKLTKLLTEYRIPVMVLNACQAARIDERAQDPFASVAGALLKAGIRSVVAMGYNLYVSGAQRFVPAFYQRLIENGQVAEAVRAGRQAMLEQDARVCARGEFPLQDWLVPVLYQQEPIVLPGFEGAQTATPPIETRKTKVPLSEVLPEEALELGDYGFIGRERAVQALERARLRQAQAAVLVHGMAGVGKSTLARGFLHWLHDTHGLGAGVFWFAFNAIHNAEYVINRLVEALFDPRARALALEKKQEALTSALREHPFLIVWDNFESVAGIPGTEVTPLLPEQDRQLLKSFLKKLRGGQTKILITSRSPENWLAPTECYRLPLGGLVGEERWEYCNAVVRDLGLRLDREDASFMALMQVLDGHPLAMRAVLLRLQERSAQALLEAWQSRFEGAAGDESTRRIFAAFSLLDQGLPEAYAPLLQLIGLHQRYMRIDWLEIMYQAAENPVEQSTLNGCITALEHGGLLHHWDQGVYVMHPALSGFLHQHHPASEPLQRGFVDVMHFIAIELAPRKLHEQRLPFALYGANFYRALSLAGELHMNEHIAFLTQSLALFAQHNRDFATARRLFESLAEHWTTVANQKGVASVYHQLGKIAQEQRDFDTAAKWYQKSLDIKEKLGDEHHATLTYHHLGWIAQEQRDFDTAVQWHQKTLDINEKLGDAPGVALTYHHLGMIASEQRDFDTAAKWYQKSLDINEKLGDEYHAAMNYHHLGVIASGQRDFDTAAKWYQKALEITEKLGDEYFAAFTYHNLGEIASEQRDFDTATKWYQKSLDINEKLGNEHVAAGNYQKLGWIAGAQRDFETAEAWFQKALAINEKLGDAHGAAITYQQLGWIAGAQRDFETAEAWFQRSLAIEEKLGDEHGAARTYKELGGIALVQSDFETAEAWFQRSLAIEEKLGDEHGAARTYGTLGLLFQAQKEHLVAGEWFLKAIAGFSQTDDQHHLGIALSNYAQNLQAADESSRATLRERWQAAGLDKLIPFDALEKRLND